MDLLMSDSDDDERNFSRVRNFRQRQYFELENFEERFRLSRTQCDELLQHIGPDCASTTGRSLALSAPDKLLLALRFYASGGFYYSVGDANGPSKASVCRAVHQITAAVNRRLFQVTIRWPNPVGTLANRFYNYANMPCVAGAVDGTLVEILAPTEDEDQYVDRHGTHSINAMFVCGPNLRFYAAAVRWPGAVNDARVLRNSVLRRSFENGFDPYRSDSVLHRFSSEIIQDNVNIEIN
uniref:Putative nuclease HARBI1 n=1 Tax=Plectus sambesii TaxID=2011161 RepID=A0A914V606_9BILA